MRWLLPGIDLALFILTLAWVLIRRIRDRRARRQWNRTHSDLLDFRFHRDG